MYKILKPFKWFLVETGKTVEFVNQDVSTCGKKLEDLGADALKELELKKYIGKCSEKLPNLEPPEDNDQKIKKRAKKEK